MSAQWTVGAYLARRLEQAGVGHVFGVPGDYCLPFFDDLEASAMELVGTCNELNGGYAADGYARIRGAGAVAVTYDVGGFSLLNAIAGAHAERVPVIAVSGAPRTTEAASHHMLHHMTGDLNVQHEVYRTITESAVRLLDPLRAPEQIDAAITASLRERRPAYIELPLDMSRAACRAPGVFSPDTVLMSDRDAVDEAAGEVADLLEAAAAAGNGAVVIAGVEAHRLGLTAELQALIEHLGCPFVTTLSSKTVLSEAHPQFAGVYIGALGCHRTQVAVEEAAVVLSLGAIMSDIDLGLSTGHIDPLRLVAVNSDRARIHHHVYDRVTLADLIATLRRRVEGGLFTAGPAEADRTACRYAPVGAPYVPAPARAITIARFYERLESFLGEEHVLLADAGDSVLAAADLAMPAGSLFLAQGYYLSIGWTVGATLGAKCAAPSRRPLTLVGDGAFQTTAQELSTIVRLRQNPIVFVMNNEGYVIERYIHDGPYNDINVWKYSHLAEVFGGPPGLVVETEGDLEAALVHAQARPDELVLVEVRLDRLDASQTLKRFGHADR